MGSLPHISSSPYLRKKFENMEQTQKKSTTLYWILFLVSVAAFFVMYYSPFANYITATLPFICYYLVKAMDLI